MEETKDHDALKILIMHLKMESHCQKYHTNKTSIKFIFAFRFKYYETLYKCEHLPEAAVAKLCTKEETNVQPVKCPVTVCGDTALTTDPTVIQTKRRTHLGSLLAPGGDYDQTHITPQLMAYITRLSIYENDYNKQQTIHHTNSKFKKYNSNNKKMNDLTMNDSDNNCVLITSHTLNKQISSSNSNEESYSNSNEEKEQDKNNRNPFIKPIQLNNNN